MEVREDAATDSGSAIWLQLSSRTVSVGAGGRASEQFPKMIITSRARPRKNSLREFIAPPVHVGSLRMIASSLGGHVGVATELLQNRRPRHTPQRLICGRVRSNRLCVFGVTMLAPLLATDDPYAAASIFS